MVNWIFRVQGAEEPGKNEPSPAISQTTAPKTGIADPYVFVPLGIAAVAALGTVKLSRKEKKERRKNCETMEKGTVRAAYGSLDGNWNFFPGKCFCCQRRHGWVTICG